MASHELSLLINWEPDCLMQLAYT